MPCRSSPGVGARWGQATRANPFPAAAPRRAARQAAPGPRGGASTLGSSGCKSPKKRPSPAEASALAASRPQARPPPPHRARPCPASGSRAPASRPHPYLPDPVQGVHEALGFHPHRSTLPLHQLRHYRPRRRHRSAPPSGLQLRLGTRSRKGKVAPLPAEGKPGRSAREEPRLWGGVRACDHGPAGSGGGAVGAWACPAREVAVRPQEAGICVSPDQIWARPVDDVVTGPKARMWPEVSGSRLFGNPGRSDVVFPKTAPKLPWFTKNLTLAAPPRKGHWFEILGLSSLKWQGAAPRNVSFSSVCRANRAGVEIAQRVGYAIPGIAW